MELFIVSTTDYRDQMRENLRMVTDDVIKAAQCLAANVIEGAHSRTRWYRTGIIDRCHLNESIVEFEDEIFGGEPEFGFVSWMDEFIKWLKSIETPQACLQPTIDALSQFKEENKEKYDTNNLLAAMNIEF